MQRTSIRLLASAVAALGALTAAGGWRTAQEKFFNDGGVFDEIYQPGS
jgi:ABC-type sulfate transport system substrate-binding protein